MARLGAIKRTMLVWNRRIIDTQKRELLITCLKGRDVRQVVRASQLELFARSMDPLAAAPLLFLLLELAHKFGGSKNAFKAQHLAATQQSLSFIL